MSGLNSQVNRVVWCDVPVADLDRAAAFYDAVIGVKVHKESMNGFSFGVLDHKDGNGGCLVPKANEVGTTGMLVYFNVDGRIAAALKAVERHGGSIVEPVQSIGPHGFRAVIIDSEGNRIALHSEQPPEPA